MHEKTGVCKIPMDGRLAWLSIRHFRIQFFDGFPDTGDLFRGRQSDAVHARMARESSGKPGDRSKREIMVLEKLLRLRNRRETEECRIEPGLGVLSVSESISEEFHPSTGLKEAGRIVSGEVIQITRRVFPERLPDYPPLVESPHPADFIRESHATMIGFISPGSIPVSRRLSVHWEKAAGSACQG